MIYTDENGLTYELNQENFTAIIVKCNRKIINISIPRSVRYGSQDFVITTIGQQSFAYHNHITQITFSSDSELKLIDKESFLNSTLFLISIPSSVIQIGSKAFYGCCYLQIANINDDSQLSIIEEEAFKYSGIEKFSLPPFVKKICEGSFDVCSRLSTFSIPKNSQLTTIGKEAFSWTKISYLYFPDDLKEFGNRWCFAMSELEQIEISPKNENFKYINEDHSMIASKSDPNDDSYDVLFLVTRKVEFVSVPSFTKYINTSAISGCEKLEDIEFKKKSQLISIDEGAFSYSNISSIIIPASVKQIKQYAFYHCEHLEEVSFKKSSKLESIGKCAFANTVLLKFYFPENLVKFDKEWCYDIYYLRYIEVSPLNKCLSYIDENFIISKSNPNDDVFDSLLFVNRTAKKVKIPSFIKYIKSSAFYYCDELQTVELPDDSQLVSIESNAFSFSSLKEFFVPKHVKVIKKNAFESSNLKSIKFHEDSELVKIGKSALDTDSLESFTIPANVEVIKEGFNSNCRILKHISISPKNKNFKILNENLVVGKSDPKSDCFDNLIFVNDDFDKITIPSFIKRICKYVFNSVVNLKTVDFEENSKLASIGVSAFENTSIKCIIIPNSVKIIEKNAFQNCENLTNVEFLGDHVLVDNQCFFESKLVKLISFPNARKVSLAFDALQQSCKMYICAGGEIIKLLPMD